MKEQNRSLTERIIHAVSFEVIALVICAPIAAWLLDKPLFQMGGVAIMLSTLAMLWNMIYNAGFDRFYLPGQPRSLWVRICHALGFESGFILMGLPIAASILQITLFEALMVEIGFFLFFLPYTIIFNMCYDQLRTRRLQLVAEE